MSSERRVGPDLKTTRRSNFSQAFLIRSLTSLTYGMTASGGNSHIFNMRCRDEDVIPTSLRIKPKVRTREGYAIAERASKAFLRARVHQTFHRKQSLTKQITKLEASLEDLLTEDYSKVTRLSHNSAEKAFVKSKQNHQSKQKQPELRPEGRDRWVVNLTERVLSPSQQEVLSMGLNYAPVPTKFPLQDTIASVEKVAKQLPKDDADDL